MRRELGFNPAKISDQKFKRRVVRLAVILSSLILILACRLFYLQIVQHQYYLAQEERNRSNLLSIEPSRGLIYDRNGVVLADDIAVYSLVIQRDKTKNLNETLTELQKLLKIDSKQIHIFLKDVKNHPRFAPIPLLDRLTEQQMATFMLNQYRFPGASVQILYIRHYPLGEAFAPVIGYVSRINPKELEQVDPANYSASTNIGKTGIEKYFEKDLHGQVGYKRVAMDAFGRQISELDSTPPIPGHNLTLTIDSQLQEVAYRAFNGTRGSLVAIQPETGQILAMVSSPSYDPNLFVSGIDSKTYQSLQNNPAHPLYNRAVRGLFPFGSTVKPFYALQGLETGTVTPDFTIFDPGYFKLPGVARVYHNWTWGVRRGGQGTVNITKALEQSNDTYFFTLAMKLGPDRLADILQKFGFGQKTGLEIPEEVAGHLATPAWKKKYRHDNWYAGDTLAAGIGQGYTITTPVQLAQGVSEIANKGTHHKLTLLLQEQTPDGKPLPQQSPLLPSIQLKPSTWDVVIDGMEKVISLGTGSYHFGQKEFGKPEYTAAGKTGTAQVFNLKNQRYNKKMTPVHLRDHSLFIVFAPIDKPKIAVAVIQENEGDAGLIARKVVDYYLLDELKQPEKSTIATQRKPISEESTAETDDNPDENFAVQNTDDEDEIDDPQQDDEE